MPKTLCRVDGCNRAHRPSLPVCPRCYDLVPGKLRANYWNNFYAGPRNKQFQHAISAIVHYVNEHRRETVES